jgi:TIR domain/HEAT repeats
MEVVCFISHPWKHETQNNAGHQFGLRLGTALRARGLQIWIDEEQMPPGTTISASVKAGIEHHSDIFLFILSRDALSSLHCMEELQIATQFQKPIIVLIRGACEVPPILRDKIHLELRDTTFDAAMDRLVEGIKKLTKEYRIIEMLNNDAPSIRIRASRILCDLRYPKAIQVLSKRIREEPDPDVLHWIIICLGELAGVEIKERDEVLILLRQLEDHPSPRVRQGIQDARSRILDSRN